MDEETLAIHFPTRTDDNDNFKSFVFQPERLSINSRVATLPTVAQYQYQIQNFNQFTNNLKSPVLRVKSLQLLRATMSLPIPSIPNSQTTFFYYRLPIKGSGASPSPYYDPDYTQMTSANIKIVRLLSTYTYSPSRYTTATAATYGFNGIFQDYQSITDALNRAAVADPNSATLGAYYTSGDVSFTYDATSQKIIFSGTYIKDISGRPLYYYIPCGFSDPNLPAVQTALTGLLGSTVFQFETGYTLNKRLGYLWNGVNVNEGAPNYGGAPNYTYPIPDFAGFLPWTARNSYYADSYADLVNTQNVFVYCDIVGGSTQDTNITDNLLAVVPLTNGQLGVQTFQSTLDCPLMKVANNIYEISIMLMTDTGAPLWIPVNGFVNIEFALKY